MAEKMTFNDEDLYVLQSAIGAYRDEAYTNARKLSGTGIVSGNPEIDKNTETYVGQMRWMTPLNPQINIASLTDPTEGDLTSTASDFAMYIKSVRTMGAKNVNLNKVITQKDGLAKFGRDLAENKGQDEHNAILAVLKGVAIAEALNGAASGSGEPGLGGQTFENDPTDKHYGFYVDMGTDKLVTDASAGNIGAARAHGFLEAFGKAWKDYEPEYAYLITSPEVMASLRSANLVDSTRITDGSVDFETIFQGKLRLIQTRANQSMTAAELARINAGSGVDIVGTKTSFIVLPGSVAMEPLDIEIPVEIERKAGAYKGGGTTTVWNRWGYVAHPAGYDWKGLATQFPSDAGYKEVKAATVNSGLPVALTEAGLATKEDEMRGVWERKTSSALSLGILPVFHS